jgi:hypothetical protein
LSIVFHGAFPSMLVLWFLYFVSVIANARKCGGSGAACCFFDGGNELASPSLSLDR